MSSGGMMETNDIEYYTNLDRAADLDPEIFAAALAVQHVRSLIANGGSRSGWPDLPPHCLEAFLSRAVETAQKTKYFEREWRRLQRVFPHVKDAWEKGQTSFQKDLIRVADNPEEMEYLSLIDFAVDCYAYVSARNEYPANKALQAWAMNGYIRAWRQHFLNEEDTA
jgi:hypothetical protein